MSQRRILVVDDDPAMLHSVERVLARSYVVETAPDAETALTLQAEHRPDLAILDIRMPGRDGFELQKDLRAEQPELDVIFMTGAVHELDAQLIRAIRENAYYFVQKPFDRDVLLTLVDRCLEQRRLTEENRAHVATLEAELASARAFQESLLPPRTARIGTVEIAGRYEPCDALGGDLFDYVDVGDGRATLLVADVSGHGVSAAMLTGIVKSGFHDAHLDRFEPRAVVNRIAAAMRPFDYDRFVTLFCARLSPATRTLEYVNAGHPAPLLLDAKGTLHHLEPTGPMISPAYPDLGWDGARRALDVGDRLFVFTDGFTETRGDEGFFGEERLQELFCAAAATSPDSTDSTGATETTGADVLARIVAQVEAFAGRRPVDDDRTAAYARVRD